MAARRGCIDPQNRSRCTLSAAAIVVAVATIGDLSYSHFIFWGGVPSLLLFVPPAIRRRSFAYLATTEAGIEKTLA